MILDKELIRWKSNLANVVSRFDDICWTSYFTIDRIRSQCISKKFSLTDESLCECCTLLYVNEYRAHFSQQENRKLRKFFGPYVEHVILYWYWYGRCNGSFLSHVWKYYRLYSEGSPTENVLKIVVSVYFGNLKNSSRKCVNSSDLNSRFTANMKLQYFTTGPL